MFGLELYDILILLFLAVMTVRGGISGIVSQVLSLGSLFLAWLLSINGYKLVSGVFPAEATWNKPVSMLVVFVLAMIGLKIVTSIIRGAIRKSVLREFDRQLGALLGGVKGLVICLVITFFCVTMSDVTRNAVAVSRSGKYFVAAINKCAVLIPDDVEHSVFKDQLAKFKETTEEAGMVADSNSLQEDIEELKEKLSDDILSPESAAVAENSRKEAEAQKQANHYESLANSFEDFVNQWQAPQKDEQTPDSPDPTAWGNNDYHAVAAMSNYPSDGTAPALGTAPAANQTVSVSLPLPDLNSQLNISVPVPDRQTVTQALSQVVSQTVSQYIPNTTAAPNTPQVMPSQTMPSQTMSPQATPLQTTPLQTTPLQTMPVQNVPTPVTVSNSYNSNSYSSYGNSRIPSYNNLMPNPNTTPTLGSEHTFTPYQTAPGLR